MFNRYFCAVCGYIYDEEIGDIHHGILPGTLWENIPDSWFCPDCNVSKSDFVLLNFE